MWSFFFSCVYQLEKKSGKGGKNIWIHVYYRVCLLMFSPYIFQINLMWEMCGSWVNVVLILAPNIDKWAPVSEQSFKNVKPSLARIWFFSVIYYFSLAQEQVLLFLCSICCNNILGPACYERKEKIWTAKASSPVVIGPCCLQVSSQSCVCTISTIIVLWNVLNH